MRVDFASERVCYNKIIQYYDGFNICKTHTFLSVIPAVFHAKLFAHNVMAGLSHFKWPMCYDYLCSCRILLSSRPTAFGTLTNTRVSFPRGNFVRHITESLIIISNVCTVLVARCFICRYNIVNI